MGICSWRVVNTSVRDLTASPEALSHAASATLTTTNTIAASSKHMQKTCNKSFQTTNAFTLCIDNIDSSTRDISNVLAMCRNGQQCQQGEVLRAAQQHSQSHGSKRSAAKRMMQRIVHSQPNTQPKRTQTQYTPTTPQNQNCSISTASVTRNVMSCIF